MIRLQNAALGLDVLDPREDRDKLGSRYCAGGYIWQAYDGGGRPLFSGPCFPSAAPPVFDGQGMPDMFETPLGGDDGDVGCQVCVIGVGLVEKSSGIMPFHPRNNPRVTQFCSWTVDNSADQVIMTTSQSVGDKSLELRKEVRLDGRRITSAATAVNTGKAVVNIRWFAHPFFPINNDLTCGKVSPPVSVPDNAGYEIRDDGTICMKPDYPWEKGLFQVLDIPLTKLSFVIPHPIVNSIRVETDYNAVRCAVWGNSHTFSFEPFTQHAIKPGETASWGVEITF